MQDKNDDVKVMIIINRVMKVNNYSMHDDVKVMIIINRVMKVNNDSKLLRKCVYVLLPISFL